MAAKLKPIGDRVLVEPLDEKETVKGGIIIPDTAKEKPQEGKIVAIGTGKSDDNGKKIDFVSKSATKCSSANTGAPKSRWTTSPTSSCAKTTSSASSAKHCIT